MNILAQTSSTSPSHGAEATVCQLDDVVTTRAKMAAQGQGYCAEVRQPNAVMTLLATMGSTKPGLPCRSRGLPDREVFQREKSLPLENLWKCGNRNNTFVRKVLAEWKQ